MSQGLLILEVAKVQFKFPDDLNLNLLENQELCFVKSHREALFQARQPKQLIALGVQKNHKCQKLKYIRAGGKKSGHGPGKALTNPFLAAKGHLTQQLPHSRQQSLP